MPVQWGTNPAVSQSVFLLRGLHAARPAAAPANQDYYYLETDTAGGTLFQSTGSAWVQVAGAVTDVDTATFAGLTDVDTTGQVDGQIFAWNATAGKYEPAAGVVGDASGDLTLDGSVSSGDFSYVTERSSAFAGQMGLFGGAATLNGSSTELAIQLLGALTANRSAITGDLERLIDRAGFAVGNGVLRIVNGDTSGGVSPIPDGELIVEVIGSAGLTVLRVNHAGGLAMFGQTPPTAQPAGGAATAGAAYTATEQGMLQAVYDAARAIGLLS